MSSSMEGPERGTGGPEGAGASEGTGHTAGAESSYEALRRLEQRLDRASSAAEQLISEAASEATARLGGNPGPGKPPPGSGKPPPAGWQAPEGEQRPPGFQAPADLEVLVQALRSLRDLIPPELQQRLANALREVLLALRALIDWYLDRLEQRRAKPAKVEDIPIL